MSIDIINYTILFCINIAGRKEAAAGEKTTFSCGVVPADLGQNVPLSQKDKGKFRRPKKETVLTKHRKWLADLQREKDRLEQEYLQEIQRKEEAQKRFQEQEAKMRLAAKMLMKDDAKPETNTHENDIKYADESKADASNSPSSTLKSNDSFAAAMAKGKGKPVWAMTEKAAEKASEDKEFDDAEGLLDFAKNLDYDRYIADVEIKQIMERLRKRIVDMERDISTEHQREMESDVRAAKREMLALLGDSLNNLSLTNSEEKSQFDEEIAAAKAVLQSDEQISAVHSTQSVAAMVKQAREKFTQSGLKTKNYGASEGKVLEAKVSGEPLIVVHEQSDGVRLEGKNTVSNLPYIHRNPAI